ncbi:MAG: hypothetical protein D6720_05640 [Gammaproteobacteria bacterium]|nr:MAG: hypothetical protein D6720_05640 [Gammaproteobacteria bacterium]
MLYALELSVQGAVHERSRETIVDRDGTLGFLLPLGRRRGKQAALGVMGKAGWASDFSREDFASESRDGDDPGASPDRALLPSNWLHTG